MTNNFDLVVLGTGSAGSAAAYTCRRAGWNVAIIDHKPFGGTCALRGCDPKKVLVGAGDLLDWLHRMRGKGLAFENAHIHWPELMQFKRSFTDPVSSSREKNFKTEGIATFHGSARFTGASSVAVNGEELKSRFILIATGATPVPLKIPGEDQITTSEQFLELENLPSSILFIGGGYISFEFAHIAARAGSKVMILHKDDRPLNHFDPDLVNSLVNASKEIGIDICFHARVEAIEPSSGKLLVKAGQHQFQADLVVHGAGRAPDYGALDLISANVDKKDDRIVVNDFLQSVTNPTVYVAGDAAESGPPLTPVAGRDGDIAAQNMLKGNQIKTEYQAVPSVVFTVPPLASVGLSEQQARKEGLQFETKYQETSGWYSSKRIREKHSAFKVLIEKQSGRILGAHLLGTHADEIINLFALAIRFNLTSSMLKNAFYAYPTLASNVPYML